ncbi:hypothetical protein AGR1C_pAt40374 [Agrobacterium fabacearum TT111]|nr:hypothetical protein AGR1C_pAt40374 [Agrobacterium fabacearum TT111]
MTCRKVRIKPRANSRGDVGSTPLKPNASIACFTVLTERPKPYLDKAINVCVAIHLGATQLMCPFLRVYW